MFFLVRALTGRRDAAAIAGVVFATGGAFALQALSSLYYGLFLSVYLLPLGATLWLGRRCWRGGPAGGCP